MTSRSPVGYRDAFRPEVEEITAHTALRGLAALFVILYHCALLFPDVSLGPATNLIRRGYLFVDIFFMLSGFILMRRYGELLASPTSDVLHRFWLRRFLRIYPTYFVWLMLAIAVWFLLAAWNGDYKFGLGEHLLSIVLHVAMVQSLLSLEILYHVPLWSIAVEMVAYLLLPLIAAWLVPMRRIGIALLAFVFLVGVASFIRYYGTLDVLDGFGSLVRCLLGFFLGALASLSTSRLPSAVARWSKGLSFMLFFMMVTAFMTGYIFEGYVCALAMVLMSSVPAPDGPCWTQGLLPMMLGRVSFSLYLAHVPVLSVMVYIAAKLEKVTGMPWFSSYTLFSLQVVLASLLAALLSWRWIEVGLTARLGAFLLSRRPGLAAS